MPGTRPASRQRLPKSLAAFALFLSHAATAAAIVHESIPTDETMVERARAIVFGEVLSSRPVGTDGLFTDFVLRIDERLKGAAPGTTVTVRQAGGRTADGLFSEIAGLPRLAPGDRVLLFLEPVADVWRPMELGLGTFFETVVGGRTLLLREPAVQLGSLLEEADDEAADHAHHHMRPRNARNFRRWIADRIAGRKRQADYFEPTPDPEDGPVGVRQPFRARVVERGQCAGLSHRWPASSLPVRMALVTHTAPPRGKHSRSAGDGTEEVLAAMASWNRVPGSEGRLALSKRRRTAVGPSRTTDRVNSISFSDPDGALAGRSVLATARWWYICETARDALTGEIRSVSTLIESDIIFRNGLEARWRDRAHPDEMLERVLGHELGHVLGLNHSRNTRALMYYRVTWDGRRSVLERDDRRGIRFLYPATPSTSEGKAAEVSLALSRPPGKRIRFNISYGGPGDTAAGASDPADGDYDNDAVTSVRFSPKDNSRTIRIPISDDDEDEDLETFTVTFTPATALPDGLEGTFVREVTIGDNDSSPVLVDLDDFRVTAGGAVDITARATDADNDPITYEWTRNSGETSPPLPPRTALNQARLAFTPTTTGTYTMTVTANDGNGNSDTDDVTITVAALPEPPVPPAPPTGLTATAASGQVTLSWADPDDASITGYEVRHGRTSTRDSTAWAAISGTGAGTTSHTVTGLDNGSEYSFKVRAVNPAGDGVATDWLTATPTAVSLSIADVTMSEGGAFAFVVTADPAPSSQAGFRYTVAAESTDTATAGTDFTAAAAAAMTIAANASSTTITVSVTDDALDEPDETFTVTLSAPSSGVRLGDATATGTITDDDESPVLSAIADVTVKVGETAAITATATDGDNDPIDYRWSRKSGETLPTLPAGTALNQPRLTFTAPAAGTYTMTVTASDGNGNSDTEEVVVTVRAADPDNNGNDGSGNGPGGSGDPAGDGNGPDGSDGDSGDDPDGDGDDTDDDSDDRSSDGADQGGDNGDDDDRDGTGGNDGGEPGGSDGTGGVGGPVRASFTLDAGCADDLCRTRTFVPVSFRDTSSGAVTRRTWDFGDGTTAHGRSLEHAWAAPGFYTVSLTVSGRDRSATMSRKVLVESGDPAGACTADGETLCLQDSRFSVTMEWWTEDGVDGERGAGKVVREGTNDSGLFWFFSPANWEMLVKVLDGCSVNGRMWVYGASATTLSYVLTVTDTVTGAVREYRNEPGRQAPAFTDSAAFPGSCTDTATAAAAAGASVSPPAQQLAAASVTAAAEDGNCTETAAAMCLQKGRYEVTVTWSNLEGRSGPGRVANPRTDDSGLFHFFSPANWEILVKVLDGCAFNDHHWVFAASATDVGFDLRVRDTATGRTRQYTKQAGQPARALVDVSAFPEACRPPQDDP